MREQGRFSLGKNFINEWSGSIPKTGRNCKTDHKRPGWVKGTQFSWFWGNGVGTGVLGNI